MEELIKIVSVVFLSSFKFVAGPPLAYAYDFTYVQTILFTMAGGMFGVLVISYYTPYILKFWKWLGSLFHWLVKPRRKKEVFSDPLADVDSPVEVHYVYVPSKKSGKKLFTKRNRRLIGIWNKWGLFGIALITPIGISIPIGTFLATRLVPNRKKVFLYMFLSVLFWSVLLSSLFEIYQVMSLSQLELLFFE